MNTPDTGTALDADMDEVALQIVRDVAEMDRPKPGRDVLKVTTSALRLVVLNALEESMAVPPALVAEVRRLREAVARVEACARYLREVGVESIAQGVLPETRGRGRALVECADDIQLSLRGEQPRAMVCDCGLSPEDTYGGHLATCAIVRAV